MAAPLAGIAAPDPAPRMLLLLLLLLPPPLSRGRVAVCGSGGLHGFCLCDLKHGTEQYRRRQVGHLYFGGASLQTPHFTTAGGTASCCCCCCACWCRLLPRPRFPAPLPLPLLPPLPPLPPILALTACYCCRAQGSSRWKDAAVVAAAVVSFFCRALFLSALSSSTVDESQTEYVAQYVSPGPYKSHRLFIFSHPKLKKSL